MMLAFRMEKSGEHLRAFRDEILSCLERLDFLPERLLLDQDETAALAKPIAAGLGITLQRVPYLPAFAEVLNEFTATMR